MQSRSDSVLALALRQWARPLVGAPSDYNPILQLVGDASVVLLGEASHGTHEFYRLRAELTKRLIVEHGFSAVAVEADWPDAQRAHRFAVGASDDSDAAESLEDFRRFPAWMWRNADVVDFLRWQRAHNDSLPPERRVGFYGLDLYGLHAAIDAVVDYLEKVDPEAAGRARERYACFDPYLRNPYQYASLPALSVSESCEDAVVRQLTELQQARARLLSTDGLAAEDAHFAAEQNARLILDAERYYRTLYAASVSSWNLRDTHMADTLDALLSHLGARGTPRVVVWAHNSHLGDARATEQGTAGELNLGQLVRERHPGKVLSVGFSTYEGTVTAARVWGGPAERRRVRPALAHSCEDLFHRTALERFVLPLRGLGEAAGALAEPRLQRAIGVLYRPETERASHYYSVRLTAEFDAIIHLDRTRAVEPLERAAPWERIEPPETFPTGV